MTASHSNHNKNTRTLDGWSRDADGKIRVLDLQAFQVFGALRHDPGNAPAYALNLAYRPEMTFTGFLEANAVELVTG